MESTVAGTADNHLAAARQFSRDSESDRAIDEINKALAMEPTSVEVHHVHLAIIEHHPEVKGGIQRQQLLNRAQTSVKALVVHDPTNPKTYEAAARVGLLAKDLEAASKAAGRAIELDPSRHDGHELMGMIVKRTRAIVNTDMIRLDPSLAPGSIEYHIHRAVTFSFYGLGSESLQAINEALTLDPVSEAAHIANIEVLERHRDIRQGAALIQRALTSAGALKVHSPNSAPAQEARARALVMGRDFEAAAKAAERSKEIDPERSSVHQLLAEIYRKLGRKDQAAQMYVSASNARSDVDVAPIRNSFSSKAALGGSFVPLGAMLLFVGRLARVVPPLALLGLFTAALLLIVVVGVASGLQNRRNEALIDRHLEASSNAAG